MSGPDDRAEAGTPSAAVPSPSAPQPPAEDPAAPAPAPAPPSAPFASASAPQPPSGPPSGPGADSPTTSDGPVDPVRRDLAQVAEAMAAARAGVPTPADVPQVPGDDEVAGLEQAHDTLRSTLDRVERGG